MSGKFAQLVFKFVKRSHKLFLKFVRDGFFLLYFRQVLGVLRFEERRKLPLVFSHRGGRIVVNVAVCNREYDQDLLFNRLGFVLILLECFNKPASPGELVLGYLVKIRSELRERLDLPVLGKLKPQGSGDVFHRLYLRASPYPGN